MQELCERVQEANDTKYTDLKTEIRTNNDKLDTLLGHFKDKNDILKELTTKRICLMSPPAISLNTSGNPEG